MSNRMTFCSLLTNFASSRARYTQIEFIVDLCSVDALGERWKKFYHAISQAQSAICASISNMRFFQLQYMHFLMKNKCTSIGFSVNMVNSRRKKRWRNETLHNKNESCARFSPCATYGLRARPRIAITKSNNSEATFGVCAAHETFQQCLMN